MQIESVTLAAEDLAAQRAFYAGVLGLPELPSAEGAAFQVGRSQLLFRQSAGAAPRAHIAFAAPAGSFPLARDWVAKRIDGNASFTAMDTAVADEGWRIVLLTRLSPLFPFTLLNYAFGLTRVSLRDYVLASWIGMMPGTVMYVYLGSLARAGVANHGRTPAEWILYGAGLLATIAVAVVATRGVVAALGGHARRPCRADVGLADRLSARHAAAVRAQPAAAGR